jgi:hypothetical protein
MITAIRSKPNQNRGLQRGRPHGNGSGGITAKSKSANLYFARIVPNSQPENFLWFMRIQCLVEPRSIGLDMGHPRAGDFSGRGLWDICDDRRVSCDPLVGEHPLSRARAEYWFHSELPASSDRMAASTWLVGRRARRNTRLTVSVFCLCSWRSY